MTGDDAEPGESVAFELVGVEHHFGRHAVLRGVSLALSCGEITGLVGANGAGKTTLLDIAAGLLAPTGGRRRLAGATGLDLDTAARGRIAYVGHQVQLYPTLSVRENLELFVDLCRAVNLPTVSLAGPLHALGLEAHVDRLVRTLSRGMKQRVSLARAVLTRPDVLLLDEPFTALDMHGAEVLAALLLRERERGAAILVSSHDLVTLGQVCDRAMHLDGGRLVAEVEKTADRSTEAFRKVLSGWLRRDDGARPHAAGPTC